MLNQTSEADISRAHTDFVANASHELRTPLASIIGYVETLLEDGAAKHPKVREKFLSTILKEAKPDAGAGQRSHVAVAGGGGEERPPGRTRYSLPPLVERASRDAAGLERAERLKLELADVPAIRAIRASSNSWSAIWSTTP